jgi:hypothetical protein
MRLINRLRSGLIFGALSMALCAPTFAVNYACSGPVNGVSVSPGGVVSAESAGGQHWGYFCNLGTTNNNVSSEACKGILATLLAAQHTEKVVTLWFGDDYDCNWHASNGSWAWLTTWYWGPTASN